MNNKEFKQAIKKHELKQVCAWPVGQTITRIYVTTDRTTQPMYYKSVWALGDDMKLKVTNTKITTEEAEQYIHHTYVMEVRRLKLLGNGPEAIGVSRDVANGKGLVSRTMDARKWHKLRADILQFMLKDCRIYDDYPHDEVAE